VRFLHATKAIRSYTWEEKSQNKDESNSLVKNYAGQEGGK